MKNKMQDRPGTTLLFSAIMLLPNALAAGQGQISDLSGTYDVATLTPLERPAAFGDNLFLSKEEADKISANENRRMK